MRFYWRDTAGAGRRIRSSGQRLRTDPPGVRRCHRKQSTWSRSPPLPAYDNYITPVRICQSANIILATNRLSEMCFKRTQ